MKNVHTVHQELQIVGSFWEREGGDEKGDLGTSLGLARARHVDHLDRPFRRLHKQYGQMHPTKSKLPTI